MATHASLLSPEKAVFGYAIIFVIAGFVMGIVAREVRKQVEAALCEAEGGKSINPLNTLTGDQYHCYGKRETVTYASD